MTITALNTFLFLFSFLTFAEESRLLASITDVENKLEAHQRINTLSANIKSVNIIREHFMKKYIKEYKAKEDLSKKDIEKFQKDLEIVLNSKKIMKAKKSKRKPSSWESPKSLLASFSPQERKEMNSYFNYFNKEVFPLLREGMKKKDKEKIVDGLTKWDNNAQAYNQFIQKNIDKLKKKAS